ncbi:hypothetical protein T265_06376 [Opisthorchis viverrini]|uniref:Uncharacterized protein n=1 Tax=Opisthorchis viverrini TaxID=6198 RepID=A0A074ZGA9_OPIVI|nr:hypothetical protein T265_06376 [Opisthorchis viverrini]KER26326.1 hypothetical protein T265_06376 [Opisthorchis viverrini]
MWLERKFTARKVRGSNPTSTSRLPLSRLGHPGSIPALVQPSGDSSLVDMLDTEESESRSLKPPKPLCTQRARRGNDSQGGDSRSRTSTTQQLPSTSHHADVSLSVPRGENSLGGSTASLNHSRTLIMEHTREHHGWFSSSDEEQPEGHFVGAQDTLDKYSHRSPQVRSFTPGSVIQHEVSETRPITELRRPNHSPVSTGTTQTSAPDKQAPSERGSREVLTNAERNTDDVTILLSQNDMFRIVWLERELTDRKVRGSSPTSASRLLLSRFGQPDSIPALVQPLGSMAVRHRKGATAE